jgi:hypothetical protein
VILAHKRIVLCPRTTNLAGMVDHFFLLHLL